VARQSFPKTLRVRQQADFDRAYQARLFAADDVLVVNACPTELPHPRLGLSVSKKVGNAVARNRWKRLIREAFRLLQAEIPGGVDLIVRPQKGAAEPELAAIQRSLVELARRVARKIERAGTDRPRGRTPSPPPRG
jgi:ribonuclease P protein component